MRKLQIRLYGHRGASRIRVENTLEAFAKALEDGANALETDVHATSDGHFVVFHDDTGRRLAGDPRPIRSLSLDDVRRWRLPGDHTVPTLDELLAAFPDVPISIDLKPRRPGLVPAFLDVLERHGAADRVTVASFHHGVMAAVHDHGWRGLTSLCRREVLWLLVLPEPLARRLVRGRSVQVPVRSASIRLDGDAFIARCRRLDLRLDYWVINDADEAADLFARGATGIMTDDPAALATVFQSARERG